jgi:hypothetical protein
MTIYDGYSVWNASEYPAVLAIGDSWFWYPGNDILEALAKHPKLKPGYEHIVRLGQNGAPLSSYVDLPGRPGKFSKLLAELLQTDPMQYLSVFAVSGAGNDAVDYGLGLKTKCTGATTPEDCISEAGMNRLMRGLTRDLGLLLHEVLWAFAEQQRQPVVLLHGYDYPIPDGRGFDAGPVHIKPWLAPAMDARRVPKNAALRLGIARILIDRLNAEFARYAQPASGIWFVDSRGTLSTGPDYKDDWANELHPTPSGFDKIIDRKWIPVLQQAGIARP